MTDPIADLPTCTRDANTVRHEVVGAPSPNMKKAVASILLQEGYIKELEEYNGGVVPILRISLEYGADKERVITGIGRISKPELRVYCKRDEIPKVLSGLGVTIISTLTGLSVDGETRKAGLGEEVVCYAW